MAGFTVRSDCAVLCWVLHNFACGQHRTHLRSKRRTRLSIPQAELLNEHWVALRDSNRLAYMRPHVCWNLHHFAVSVVIPTVVIHHRRIEKRQKKNKRLLVSNLLLQKRTPLLSNTYEYSLLNTSICQIHYWHYWVAINQWIIINDPAPEPVRTRQVHISRTNHTALSLFTVEQGELPSWNFQLEFK